MIISQARLFNTDLNKDQINYIITNNIMIYDEFTNINYEDYTNNVKERLFWNR